MRLKLRLLFSLFLALVAHAISAQRGPADSTEWVRAHYTKYEFRIPMRDGVHLFASVYVPQATAFKSAGPFPFLVQRTPYSCAPYGVDQYTSRLGYATNLAEAGYIFVCEDVRGRWNSEGQFVEMRPHIDKKGPHDIDDSTDMYDTVEFLLKNVPNNNGRVGIYGISYPGFFTSASIIDSHPAIKAASPQAPMTDLYLGADDNYHGGAFMLAAYYDFYTFFKLQKNPTTKEDTAEFDWGTPDRYQFFLRDNLAGLVKLLDKDTQADALEQISHTTYDNYWKPRNLAPHLKNITTPVLTVGGWFDAEDLTGPLKVFNAVDQQNPQLGAQNTIIIGPWVHGGWARNDGDHLGDVTFGAKTAEFFRNEVQLPFFEHYLKDAPNPSLPKVYAFETGTNAWRKYQQWPPASAAAQTLYFNPDGTLTMTPARPGENRYVSDPHHPVPFTEYTTDTVPQRYMVDDQRFASRRPDVLTYTSAPLEEDVTIAGPISPVLQVASTGTDSDFDVKLIDVYPSDYPNNPSPDAPAGKRITSAPPVLMGGYQQLVRGEPFRAKFRNSWEHPEPLKPGEKTTIKFQMPDVNHTFRRGHRIMVQVQSSWFPLTDRNPQTFCDIPTAKPEQFVPATETIFTGGAEGSGVQVLVLH